VIGWWLWKHGFSVRISNYRTVVIFVLIGLWSGAVFVQSCTSGFFLFGTVLVGQVGDMSMQKPHVDVLDVLSYIQSLFICTRRCRASRRIQSESVTGFLCRTGHDSTQFLSPPPSSVRHTVNTEHENNTTQILLTTHKRRLSVSDHSEIVPRPSLHIGQQSTAQYDLSDEYLMPRTSSSLHPYHFRARHTKIVPWQVMGRQRVSH
jgi:hypothetical protein